jgi:hypothetical protein
MSTHPRAPKDPPRNPQESSQRSSASVNPRASTNPSSHPQSPHSSDESLLPDPFSVKAPARLMHSHVSSSRPKISLPIPVTEPTSSAKQVARVGAQPQAPHQSNQKPKVNQQEQQQEQLLRRQKQQQQYQPLQQPSQQSMQHQQDTEQLRLTILDLRRELGSLQAENRLLSSQVWSIRGLMPAGRCSSPRPRSQTNAYPRSRSIDLSCCSLISFLYLSIYLSLALSFLSLFIIPVSSLSPLDSIVSSMRSQATCPSFLYIRRQAGL